jgi:hypothetical protein
VARGNGAVTTSNRAVADGDGAVNYLNGAAERSIYAASGSNSAERVGISVKMKIFQDTGSHFDLEDFASRALLAEMNHDLSRQIF